MLTVRRAFWIFGSGWVGAWAARIFFEYVVGLDGTALLACILAGFVVGAVLGLRGAREIEPWTDADQRDAFLGWTTFFGFVLVVTALLALPMPWKPLAALAVVAATVAVLRRASRNSVRGDPAS